MLTRLCMYKFACLCDYPLSLSFYYTIGSFKLQFSLGFVTSCYVIMNISIAWTIDKLKIKQRESFNLKEGNALFQIKVSSRFHYVLLCDL